jgi:hypothetical protein
MRKLVITGRLENLVVLDKPIEDFTHRLNLVETVWSGSEKLNLTHSIWIKKDQRIEWLERKAKLNIIVLVESEAFEQAQDSVIDTVSVFHLFKWRVFDV